MPDLSQPHHLPNLREGKQPPDKGWLPRQRRGTTPQMIGRYPDFDVFDAVDGWDAATRRTIQERMDVHGRAFEFFSAQELPTLRAFSDVVLAQDEDPRVPVCEMVDEKLAAGRLDGYQYADMPDDRNTWHLVIRGLDEVAQGLHGARFADLALDQQEQMVGDFAEGKLSSGVWQGLNQKRAWSVCMRMLLSAFYSHPWAWNEIGFGGPAYPRGFMRFGTTGIREPFERRGATDEDPVQVSEILQQAQP
jgi:Gluconate 2-dehydrogenase subunit 3